MLFSVHFKVEEWKHLKQIREVVLDSIVLTRDKKFWDKTYSKKKTIKIPVWCKR
jgi:hypothetical protein